LAAPAGACDCHMHIYDPRFAPLRPGSRMQAQASVAEYRRLQRRPRPGPGGIVTPPGSSAGTAVTLGALPQPRAAARGVAVVHPDVSDAALARLAAGGVRGIRFTQFDPATAVTTLEMIAPLSRRVAGLGWHVQIHLRADQIVAAASLWEKLPSTI